MKRRNACNAVVIGKCLRQIRKAHGIKQKVMARMLGFYGPNRLRAIEGGKNLQTLETLYNFAEIFDIRVSDIIQAAEEME